MYDAPLRAGPAPTLDADRPLTEPEAWEHVAAGAFRPAPPRRVGAEIEWHVTGRDDPRLRPDPESVRGVLESGDGLPRRTRLTFEPGGALELSTPPFTTLGECFDAVEDDRRRAEKALDTAGLELRGIGLDPVRLPRRVLRSSRYQSMEQLFDQDGRAGRWMMANTASVQVCLDTGTADGGPDRFERRWALAGRLAPLLLAAFAHSPVRRGRLSLWRSTRQHVWSAVDATRSRPAPLDDPRESWARYALDARVMAIRDRGRWLVPVGLTFREWVRSGSPRPPTAADLDFHLTTLFPPVRPRGRYLELRAIDAQPGGDWVVPVAVARALIDDPVAADLAWEATERLWDGARPVELYVRAASSALRDPVFAKAAEDCIGAALAALARQHADARVTALAESYAERYVARGRTPADDRIDEHVAASRR